MGDSITAGYGVGSNFAFPLLYYRTLVTRMPDLVCINYGVNGLSSGGLAQMLSNRRVRTILAQSRIMTITIGSNDLLLLGARVLRGERPNVHSVLAGMANNLFWAGTKIRELNSGCIVLVATLYNPMPASPLANYAGLGQEIINQANATLLQWSNNFGFLPVFVDRAFKGKERIAIGPDHLHPSIAGHQIIATQFAQVYGPRI